MGTTYFKTIFYAPYEIKFIIMNLIESYNYVDKFIVVEANVTHVGEKHEYIFEQYRDEIPDYLYEKVIYIKSDLESATINCLDSKDDTQIHTNEALIWDSFENYLELKDDDIVISTDADEVIYDRAYPLLFSQLKKYDALFLPLHCFIYRMNYLWTDNTFWGPTVAYSRYYKDKPHPHKWRYEGKFLSYMSGCHFTWQLTIEEMLQKLQTYGHHAIYGHLADEQILKDAVENKKYPFEPKRPFHIVEVDPKKTKYLYPKSFYLLKDKFVNLLPEN